MKKSHYHSTAVLLICEVLFEARFGIADEFDLSAKNASPDEKEKHGATTFWSLASLVLSTRSSIYSLPVNFIASQRSNIQLSLTR